MLAATVCDAPNSRLTTSTRTGTYAAETIVQVLAMPSRIRGHIGESACTACSPRISEYSSATQYTIKVTRTATAKAVVGRRPPAEAKTAAVMTVPYMPADRRRAARGVPAETNVPGVTSTCSELAFMAPPPTAPNRAYSAGQNAAPDVREG